jgi:hypothetical protein
MRTPIKRLIVLMLVALLSLGASLVYFGVTRLSALAQTSAVQPVVLAQPSAVQPVVLAQSSAVQPVVLAQPNSAQSDAAQAGIAAARNSQNELKGGSETSAKAFDTKNRTPHWSVFNLATSLLSLLIAFVLIARLGVAVLREDRLEAEAWERLRAPRTLADMEKAAAWRAALYGDDGAGGGDDGDDGTDSAAGAAGIAGPAAGFAGTGDGNDYLKDTVLFDERLTAFNQLCTSVCVGFALVSIIVFFIVERFDAPMVIFDILSPLFGILLALTLFGAACSLLSGIVTLALKRESGSKPPDHERRIWRF